MFDHSFSFESGATYIASLKIVNFDKPRGGKKGTGTKPITLGPWEKVQILPEIMLQVNHPHAHPVVPTQTTKRLKNDFK